MKEEETELQTTLIGSDILISFQSELGKMRKEATDSKAESCTRIKKCKNLIYLKILLLLDLFSKAAVDLSFLFYKGFL